MRVLDTNVAIALLTGRSESVRTRFAAHRSERTPIMLSAIVVFELWYGTERSARRSANQETLRRFMSQGIETLAFDEEDAREAARIRGALASRGTPIGPYDVLIAAQALQRGAILVTANTREFSRVDGLLLENWIEL